MKVLMLAIDYPPNIYGGLGVHAYNLSKELAKLNCDVTVISVPYEHFLTSDFTINIEDGVTVIRFLQDRLKEEDRMNMLWRYSAYLWNDVNNAVTQTIYNIVEDNSYDIIHAHEYFHVLTIDAIRRNIKIPILTTMHTMRSNPLKIQDHLRRFICKISDGLIAVSNAVKIDIENRYKPAAPINVVYNGIDNSRFIQQAWQRDEPKRILFCGRLEKIKNCEILIRACGDIIQKSMYKPSIHLDIVGEGSQFEFLKKLCIEKEILNYVTFHGHLDYDEVRKLMNHSYITVIPSLNEAFSLVTLEAMSEGSCIVASRIDAISELVEHEVNGILFNPYDVDDLLRSLLIVLEDIDKRNGMVRESKLKSFQYNWGNIAQETLHIYENIFNKFHG